MFHDWSFLILRCAEILLIAYGFYSSIICIFSGVGGSVFPICFIYVSCLLINCSQNIRNKSVKCLEIAFFEVLVSMCVWVGNWV